MGTEVLSPQDWLIERIRVAPAVFHHRRRGCYGNGNVNPKVATRKPVVRPEKRIENGRPEPVVSRKSASCEDVKKNRNNSNNLVMGQVTILRRGESLDSKIKAGADVDNLRAVKTKSADDLFVCGTERLGPDPVMIPKQIRIGEVKPLPSPGPESPVAGKRADMYAGSAFSMSPSPSSLPLPSFFNKNQVSKIVDDSATRDLRRLLRLE